MAKVSAHGTIVGTIEYLTTAKRYMSDGVVLKNIGFGWMAYENARARFVERLASGDNVHATVDDIAELCRAYRTAMGERAVAAETVGE